MQGLQRFHVARFAEQCAELASGYLPCDLAHLLRHAHFFGITDVITEVAEYSLTDIFGFTDIEQAAVAVKKVHAAASG